MPNENVTFKVEQFLAAQRSLVPAPHHRILSTLLGSEEIQLSAR